MGTVHINSKCTLELENPLHGMIDAGVCHSSRITWPLELVYVKSNGDTMLLKEAVGRIPCNMKMLDTVDIGNALVVSNTNMYNSNKGTLPYLDRESMPSLIIASAMDMRFAHFEGYEGKIIPHEDTAAFSVWANQIEETESAVVLNPLRLFPMFSYDPRRYRLPDAERPGDENFCEAWDKPFAHIVGSWGSEDGLKKIWLGFRMNPTLGFRPFDEYCEHLVEFYKECEKNKVPILARCVAGGVIPGDVERYNEFDNGHREERKKKSAERHDRISKAGVPKPLCSDMYCGMNRVLEDTCLDQYYRNYGHPRNWIPVLKYFPDIRLCFAGFGGTNVWQYLSEREWATDDEQMQMPGKEWIVCIAKLTRYKNVYADFSGLNIYDSVVRVALWNILNLILCEDDDFKHLKYKLMFCKIQIIQKVCLLY
jgi:hypothetical protein